MTTNLEINFQRLMSKCEELAADQKNTDWRFEKYVLSLEDLYKSLSKTAANKLPQHTLKEYSKRVEFLKEMSTSHNKSSSLPTIINPGPIITSKDTQKKQIYQQLQVNQENALRDELFSTSKDNNTNLRDDEATSDLDLDKLLVEQQKEQDKIAEEMIEVARRIKENTLHANSIIKSDNKRLTDANTLAEKNSANLKIENERVNKNIRNCFNCWIYLMVIVVFIVFVMMVLFMKLFPKRKYYPDHSSSGSSSSADSIFNQINTTTMAPPTYRNEF